MDGEPEDAAIVVERGVLATPDEAWNLAVRRAEVIGPLAAQTMVSLDTADEAAAQLGLSRRQVMSCCGAGERARASSRT